MIVSNFEQIQYHDKVVCDFAEMMYKKMASIRYGVKFCCDKGAEASAFRQTLIKKEALDLNAIFNPVINNVVQGTGGVRISGPCSQIAVDSGRGGGIITYTPCGSFTPAQILFPKNYSGPIETICYEVNIGYVVSELPGEDEHELSVALEGDCVV